MAVKVDLNRLEMFLVGATVFLAPMNSLRHPDYYITLSDVFALTCLFIMLLNRSLPLRPLGPGTPAWLVGLMLLIVGLLASSIVNGSATRGLIISVQYGAAYFVLSFVIASRPWWQIVILAKSHVFSIFLLCVHGIYLIHIDGEMNTQFVSGNGRLKSFVERSNEFSALIAMTVPLLFWLAGNGSIRRTIAWFVLPVLIYGILLTGSASGLLALMYVFVIYYLVTISSSLRQLAFGLGGMAAIIAALGIWGDKTLLPAVFQKRVLGALESGDIGQAGTFSHRYELILEALQAVNDTYVLGLGADQYRVWSRWEQPVHNAYLLIWSEGGLIALIGLILVLFSGLLVVPRVLRQPGGKLTATCTFCMVTQFAFLINAAPHVYARFWAVPLLLGVAASLAYARKEAAFGRSRGLTVN